MVRWSIQEGVAHISDLIHLKSLDFVDELLETVDHLTTPITVLQETALFYLQVLIERLFVDIIRSQVMLNARRRLTRVDARIHSC